ncbi:protein NLP6-like isoform X3 [Salvia miltiorrhiza]|uniref:protein NLP6-like isoform X3 n=1 Tax=Salvia miltiorrhiza TaxID=226208 RepID=UPI0025AD1CF2|nr:protein NLP6-like isoform X3 [Salvia miltiorrhiza]
MDRLQYKEGVLSILKGGMGWYDSYDEISEFKQHLHQEEVGLAHEKLKYGWVLYETEQRQYSYYTRQLQDKIIKLLKHMASEYLSRGYHYMMQFWGVVKEEGKHHHLSSSHLPFLVTQLSKGVCCWYRKQSRDEVYVVNVEADGGDEEQLGGVVGRVYRNKRPESSPDLRLYSAHDFPMRDKAAACGFKGYVAFPVFDSNTNQCYGVLELLSNSFSMLLDTYLLSELDRGLQIADLRSTHNCTTKRRKPESEIKEILELAKKKVPQLCMAQVWVPCQQCQCVNINTNLCCMEFVYHVISENTNRDYDVLEYHGASEFHKLQIDIRSCHSNLCDLTISRNPMAHYAQMARMSRSFAVSLEDINNSINLYVIQFFLQPNISKDYSQQQLLMIMATKLKGFKFVVDYEKPNAIGCGLNVMESYEENFSESEFTTYLEIVSDSCCQRPSSEDKVCKGWVFSCQNLAESDSLLMYEKVENFMKSLRMKQGYWIVQFWKAKMEKDGCYLQTLDQPFVVGRLAMGLASFRTKCMRYPYFVDDQAKEEKLPPLARVFRNRHHEISPDHLFPYTTNEFSITNHAVDCGNKGGYLALPVFDDEHNHKCVGVLEFLGFDYDQLQLIKDGLKIAKLRWTYTDFCPRFLPYQPPHNIIYGKEEALYEIREALELCEYIPQLHMANVWVPNEECDISTNMSCMKLALSTSRYCVNFTPSNRVDWIHLQTRKETVLGMVLASENKSCFCHYEVSNRCEDYFAICLQSSLPEDDLLYVVEFFLLPGPPTYQYIRSFLNFLLPIIQHEFKSFKLACGKQLGEELVVEVIEFSDANKLDSSDSEHTDVFPIKFKSVQYSQHSEEQHTEEHNVAASNSKRKEKGKRKTEEPSITASETNSKEKGKQKIEEPVADSKTREKGKRKSGRMNLNLEILKQHFGKPLKDVEKELGVGRSTIKRACKEYHIDRWPNKEEHIKNLSLIQKQSGRDSQQDTSNEYTHPVIVVEEEKEKVMIKVKYKEDTIKFELCLSLGVSKLFEEVATRLKLKVDTFKLKYVDEDNDEILLACDADLHLCPKTLTATGRTCIHFFVQIISK